MSNPPFFHDASGSVRFSVMVGGHPVAASIRRETLLYRFHTSENADPLETFGLHVEEIDAAVRRRLACGSPAPVMLREYDLAVAT